ncbi:MAG: hypothetical protein ACXQTM_04355, partial [Methanosarcinales archaeon]
MKRISASRRRGAIFSFILARREVFQESLSNLLFARHAATKSTSVIREEVEEAAGVSGVVVGRGVAVGVDLVLSDIYSAMYPCIRASP